MLKLNCPSLPLKLAQQAFLPGETEFLLQYCSRFLAQEKGNNGKELWGHLEFRRESGTNLGGVLAHLAPAWV